MDEKRNTIIESIGVYLPSESLSTDDVLKGCATQFKFPLEKITGIKSRRTAGTNEFSIDLARNAIMDCLEKSKYHPGEIDILICCNISRYDEKDLYSFEPSTSVRLRKELGFVNAMVFDISNACAGMFTGVYIVDALLKAGVIRRGLVVSGEYITHLTQTAQQEIENFMDDRLACLTLGDAGAALILEASNDPKTGFQEFGLQTLGRYSSLCIAKTSERGGMIMHTDSVNLTDAAVKSGAKHAMDTLQKAGWSSEDFQYLIMHQTSRLTLNSARNEINRLLEDKVCHEGNTINNLHERGNTASTAHFIALADHLQNRSIQSGDKIIFSISASGLTIGTALYVFDDLPDRLKLLDKSSSVKEKSRPNQTAVSSPVPPTVMVRIESIGTIPEKTISNENTMAQLKRAATNCLQQSTHQRNEINLLIYSGIYRSEYLLEPAYATLLAGELDLNAATINSEGQKTLAFDVFNGSVGFLNSCFIAQQMIAAENCSTAMVVASETENNAEYSPDKLLGVRETASAIILDIHPSKRQGFSRFLFRHYEEFIEAYQVYFNPNETPPVLQMERDPGLETLYIDCIVPVVQELLAMEGLQANQIDLVFPPQISSSFIERLQKSLDLPPDKMVDTVGEGPDLFSSSIPYAMADAFDQGRVKPGDIGLVIAVGSGLQVGCAVYYF